MIHSTFVRFFQYYSIHAAKLVPHFPVMHFTVLHFQFYIFRFRIFLSCIFLPWKFGPSFSSRAVGFWLIWSLIGPSFSGPAFSVDPSECRSLVSVIGTSPFSWTYWWHAGSSAQNPTGLTEFPRRSSLPTQMRSTSNSCEQFRDVLNTNLFMQAYSCTPLRTHIKECIDFKLLNF